ncbi:MAG: sugar transferase [Beduini sp.]|uniref:sugar transferase n=1 Tax=Beduini sp. TaxID=1922300 RepID=UPI0011C7C25A
MLLKEWNDIPKFMKNEEVKKYYEILNKKRFSLILKRFFDIVTSFILLVLLTPVFFILSIWIKVDSQGPVFYRQERVTQYGKLFKIYKFRTMVINADQVGALITTQNDLRITRVGKKIRKCRLDEIPQLFNILAGDMSFVGTRPEVKKYVDRYTNEMKATLLLPAGVTSLASIEFKDEDKIMNQYVNEINSIDAIYIEKVLPEKMAFNLNSLKNTNIFNEFLILIKTVVKV